MVQLVVPGVIGIGAFGTFVGPPQATAQGPIWLQNAGFIWVPFIVASVAAAWFGMDDLADAKAGFSEQAVIFMRKHNWLMCWLYLGSFGSFIGFSAGLPMLVHSQFPHEDLSHLIWLGPLAGALLRPVGSWLADRCGAGRITFWSFVMMALGVAAVLQCLPHQGGMGHRAGSLPGFLAAFGVLFGASGIGHGSTFRMVTTIFLSERQCAAEPLPRAQAQAAKEGRVEAAAVLGLASAIGAYGGFFIPKSYGTAIAMTGSPAAALQVFLFFYSTCIALTWWHYSRRHAPMPC